MRHLDPAGGEPRRLRRPRRAGHEGNRAALRPQLRGGAGDLLPRWSPARRPAVETRLPTPQRVGRLPITEDTMAALHEGMVGATTSSRGTATHRFVDFPYTVAGKTGTAQNEGELPHAWFIGFLPAEKPEIAIAAMVENSGEGSTFSAPLFRKVAAAYYGIDESAPEAEGQGD